MFAATDAFAQLYVGLGYNNTDEKSVYQNGDNDPVITKTPLNGFYAGASYNIPIPAVNGLGITPGVYASFLLGKQHVDGVSAFGVTIIPGGNYKYKEFAIDVPIHANYAMALSGDTKFFVYGGPKFQYALSNKTEYATDGSSDYSTTDNLKGNSANRNPFNLYLGGGIGAQVAQFQIILGYDFSLLNISTKDNTTASRGQLKIGLAYAL